MVTRSECGPPLKDPLFSGGAPDIWNAAEFMWAFFDKSLAGSWDKSVWQQSPLLCALSMLDCIELSHFARLAG